MAHIHAIFGPIGAGKSTFALSLAQKHSALRFSVDEWFRNLFYNDMTGMPTLEWTFERISRCEAQIWESAKQATELGVDVILDLGLMKISDREGVRKQCNEYGIECQFYYLNVDKAERQKRVGRRNQDTGETFAFTVTPEMFEIADAMFETPTESESIGTQWVDTGVNE